MSSDTNPGTHRQLDSTTATSMAGDGSVAACATTVARVAMPEQPPATIRTHARERPPARSAGELSTRRAVTG